jgi:predicted RNase H-like nuclease (RuvC/YqgF family)
MTRVALALTLVFVTGCALVANDAARALADADARAAQGDYPLALAAYDAYLKRFPADDGAPRARAVRTMMAELVAMRGELATLREQLARARGDSAEVARLRQELSARQVELSARQAELSARQAEVTRLREDLEALKRTDLEMERRRR